MRSVLNNAVGRGLKLVSSIPKNSSVLARMRFADDANEYPSYECLEVRRGILPSL